jgi:hypothetical protein
MLGTGVKGRRKSLVVLSSGLAAAVVAVLVLLLHHKGPLPPSPVTQPPLATQSPPAAPPQRPVDAQPPILDPTFLVLASMGTTPPGARIVRVSDGEVLGYTPETVEFHQSNHSETVRFELQGYIPVTREVPAVSDTVFRIVLEPIPTKRQDRAHSPKR